MNGYRFEYDVSTREYLVWLKQDDGELVLVGHASIAVAQSPQQLYDWADKQAALLGLSSKAS